MFNGERLKNLRLAKGLNQQELANMIGACKSLISCYENGKRTPSLENMIAFMQIFGVSSDYLLGADNFIKTVESDKEVCKLLSNEEIKFIEELRKNKTVYDILFTDPKSGAELINKKIG